MADVQVGPINILKKSNVYFLVRGLLFVPPVMHGKLGGFVSDVAAKDRAKRKSGLGVVSDFLPGLQIFDLRSGAMST